MPGWGPLEVKYCFYPFGECKDPALVELWSILDRAWGDGDGGAPPGPGAGRGAGPSDDEDGDDGDHDNGGAMVVGDGDDHDNGGAAMVVGDGESDEDSDAVSDSEAGKHSPEIPAELEPPVVESQCMEDTYVDPDPLNLDEPPATQPEPVTPEAKPLASEPSGSSCAGSSTDLPSAAGLESEVDKKRQKIEMIKSGASKPLTVYHIFSNNIKGDFGIKEYIIHSFPQSFKT